MDNVKKFDETNKGVLFSIPKSTSPDGEEKKPEWELIQQGKLNINGDQLRIIGIKRLNQKGEEIVELYRAMGTLKKAEQINEKDPYAKGVVNALVDKGAMIISGWKEKSERGNAYISLTCVICPPAVRPAKAFFCSFFFVVCADSCATKPMM